jgi:hypothetical protein
MAQKKRTKRKFERKVSNGSRLLYCYNHDTICVLGLSWHHHTHTHIQTNRTIKKINSFILCGLHTNLHKHNTHTHTQQELQLELGHERRSQFKRNYFHIIMVDVIVCLYFFSPTIGTIEDFLSSEIINLKRIEKLFLKKLKYIFEVYLIQAKIRMKRRHKKRMCTPKKGKPYPEFLKKSCLRRVTNRLNQVLGIVQSIIPIRKEIGLQVVDLLQRLNFKILTEILFGMSGRFCKSFKLSMFLVFVFVSIQQSQIVQFKILF